MLIECFLSIKSLPNLLFGVLCLPGDQSHPFAQPTINPLARVASAGLVYWVARGFSSLEQRPEFWVLHYRGQESLRRNGVAIIVIRRVPSAVLGYSLKNNRMISVHFQGKPFNITVIQAYALTSNAEEAEVEQFYEDLQDLQEVTHKKDVLLMMGDWNAKVGSEETPGVTGNIVLGVYMIYSQKSAPHSPL